MKEYFPNKDEYLFRMALNRLKDDGYIDFVYVAGKQEQPFTNRHAGEGMTIRRNFNGHIFLGQWRL